MTARRTFAIDKVTIEGDRVTVSFRPATIGKAALLTPGPINIALSDAEYLAAEVMVAIVKRRVARRGRAA